jgi:uncharacterized protein with NRDE domain
LGTLHRVCLLIVLTRMDADAPLVVGANRDERFDRPAIAATVLATSGPRVLGGRDEIAGGTWLAVNEHGVVAGLTNRPAPGGRDPSKRSRGELPLALAGHEDAESAVEEFAGRFRADDYNPAWLLVGDRRSLFYVQIGDGGAPEVEPLPPGLHVLANGPLHGSSPKTDHVRDRVKKIADIAGAERLSLLRSVLSDHSVPPTAPVPPPGASERPVELAAACVHTDGYGTRSAALVSVPLEGLPHLWVADGPPCRAPFVDVDELWSAPALRSPDG